MPNYLDLEPEELRTIAEQHDRVATNVREWGKVPRAWLDDFRRTHGTIAEPLRLALEDYYQRRHDRAERQAANHEKTRDALRDAARAMEEADQNSGSAISTAGDFAPGETGAGGPPAAVPKPTDGSFGSAADAPDRLAAGAERTAFTGPDAVDPAHTSGQSNPSFGQSTAPPVAWTPPGNEAMPDRAEARTETVPPSAAGGLPVESSDGSGPAAVAVPSAASHYAGYGPTTGGPGSAPPAPLRAGPLAAAAQVTGSKKTLPSLVVGEHAEDDLALAHTVLAATLDAVADSAPGVEWAAAVARIRGGPVVALTSNEGRGWLPPGLFLPVEVRIPWTWDSILGDHVRRATEVSEGVADPAQIFAELNSLFHRNRRGITALASSTGIADNIRKAVGARAAVAERVPAARSAVDFTLPGPGMADRLALGGSEPLLHRAATLPESEIRGTCLALAHEADARIRTAIPEADEEIATHRDRRQRILQLLRADPSTAPDWLDEVRAADAMAAAAQQSRRVHVAHLPIGARPDGTRTDALRTMAFERRADELLLLLAAGVPDRQTLRDMLYAYGQIVEHPLLPVPAGRAADLVEVGAAVPRVSVGGIDGHARSPAGPSPVVEPSPVLSASPAQEAIHNDGIAGRANG